MEIFERRLSDVLAAGALELPRAVRDFVEIAAAVIRDQQARIEDQHARLKALERIEAARSLMLL